MGTRRPPRRGRRIVGAASLALVAAVSATAAAATPATGTPAEEAPCDRPAISLLRYDEDYSFLRNPECRTELWDPLKYLELNHRLPVYLTLGIDVRERFERFGGFDWSGEPTNPGGYLLQRIMPLASLHFGERFEAFIQLTSNLVWGRDPRPLDRDDLDLLQAFGAYSLGSFTVRAGRQEVEYANARLVSIREGPNVRLAFDGLRLIQRIEAWQVDGFALVPVEVRPGIFDDRPTPGQWFWGLYSTGPILPGWLGLDLYYLGLFRETAAFEQGTAREVRHTVGARVWGEPANIDYNVELTWQAGVFGAGTIGAWMVASDAGYTLVDLPARPRVGLHSSRPIGEHREETNEARPKTRHLASIGSRGWPGTLRLRCIIGFCPARAPCPLLRGTS